MKSKRENTPIEKTRCGDCKLLEHGCPKGNYPGMTVYSFFAEKCKTFESKRLRV